MAECFLSPELGFHFHTLLPPLAVRDGAAAAVFWRGVVQNLVLFRLLLVSRCRFHGGACSGLRWPWLRAHYCCSARVSLLQWCFRDATARNNGLRFSLEAAGVDRCKDVVLVIGVVAHGGEVQMRWWCLQRE